MNTNRLIISIFFLCCLSVSIYTPAATSQSDCASIEHIEEINKGKLVRIAHIKGEKALLFIALDPAWSYPELQLNHPKDVHFVEAIKEMRNALTEVNIDAVVVWKLWRPGMGVAVPFKKGCAVSGYGEPDYLRKLELMHDAYVYISQNGFNDQSARKHIESLILDSGYTDIVSDEMINVIVRNLRDIGG